MRRPRRHRVVCTAPALSATATYLPYASTNVVEPVRSSGAPQYDVHTVRRRQRSAPASEGVEHEGAPAPPRANRRPNRDASSQRSTHHALSVPSPASTTKPSFAAAHVWASSLPLRRTVNERRASRFSGFAAAIVVSTVPARRGPLVLIHLVRYTRRQYGRSRHPTRSGAHAEGGRDRRCSPAAWRSSPDEPRRSLTSATGSRIRASFRLRGVDTACSTGRTQIAITVHR